MTLYIIYTKSQYLDYILKGLDENHKISLIEVTRPKITRTTKIVRKILSTCKISFWFPKLYFNEPFLIQISRIKSIDKILFQTNPDLNELKTISNQLPDKTVKHLWLWNPLSKEYRTKNSNEIKLLIKEYKELGFIIETFDKFDADFYKIRLRNQFYRFPLLRKENIKPDYDFYFLGFPKDREKEINQLKERFKNLQLSYNFAIIKNKQDMVPYSENIKNILNTKCIVDINQKEQTGITLRPLEAIFFNKKLITNNPNITNYDFYHPNNIFILGRDNVGELPQFLRTENFEIQRDILKTYDINKWLNYYF